MSEFMRSSDAFTWSMESDPRLRSTVVTVLMLDRTPDWGEVRDRIERLSHELPMLRQIVVESPPPAPPRWQDCTDFDLDFHMRRVAAPEGGSFDDVLELARLAQMEDFDRARPLWKITLIEGLPEGEAAVLCTFHHALSDGIGGIQIAMTLFGLTPELAPTDETPEVSRASLLGDYRDAARYGAGLVTDAVTGVLTGVPRLVYDGVRSPLRTLNSVAEMATSVYRTVRPVNATGSPLMTERTLIRRLRVLEVPRPQLRDAAHRSGGALNDAFVAGVAGGLRRYHEKHGVGVGELHLTMPISLRASGDAPGGNRITLMRFDIPVGEADPAERIRQIHERTERVRNERSLPHTQLIAGFLNRMPRWYIGSILRHVDFLASDVPGIPVPVSLGGAHVRVQYAFGPTIGSAVNVTLLTYVDTCALGIDVDSGAIPDVDVFTDCLRDGFDEVLALADDD
ncbi:wax ester/triacylglycerol synthase domain-containing protein [Mycolicibacterium austroafricanum]|uniref:wax ester/triacylglycerol synthase domain-containing protein n=1 Tax=Mycolicibacterium austroafricanum TaxID=39687 RepID=UPI001CA3414E|nr:wax ester/triacylglycerol synthase domain-containing protein [Mycolicibacterium austroafricanum]QZT61836.1 WS/DGAT domain-containing protein [Mycolicibacterium austroafricanum]